MSLIAIGRGLCSSVSRRNDSGGADRLQRTELRVRYVIIGVHRDEKALQKYRGRLGWSIHVTNIPKERMSLIEVVKHYRGGWSLERDFHLVKDRPLGISPLYVRRDDQITGLTHLLMLALRVLTLIETQVRIKLRMTGEQLSGLYEGQTDRSSPSESVCTL